jgi:hypothetical protein
MVNDVEEMTVLYSELLTSGVPERPLVAVTPLTRIVTE